MKSVKCVFSLLFVLVFASAAAQFPLRTETPFLRVDPFQLHTVTASQFCWAYDVIYDKQGNNYCAGYIRGEVTDTTIKLKSDVLGSFGSDKLFFTKYLPNGTRAWFVSASGAVRPTAIRINANNEICLAGSFYGKGSHFYGTNNTSATDTLQKNLEGGFFVARYLPNGQIIDCHFYPGYELYSFETDANGNYYLGGCEEYRLKKMPEMVHRKAVLRSFNKNFKSRFYYTSDTLGDSHVASISLCRKKMAVAVSYNEHFSLGSLQHKGFTNQQGAILFFTTKGNFQMCIDSANAAPLAPGNGTFDKNANYYFAAGGYNDPLNVYGFTKSGKLKWSKNIPRYSSTTISKLMLYNNKLLFCGQGVEGLFTHEAPVVYSFKSKGSQDVFFGELDLNGNVVWLRAAGGAATEFAPAIAAFKNELALYGFVNFGGEFRFKETALETRATLWLAKFKLDSLQGMRPFDREPLQVAQPEFTVNTSACTCKRLREATTQFMPSANSYINTTQLKSFKWTVQEPERSINSSFLFKFYPSHGNLDSYYDFDLHLYKPLILEHPKKLFRLCLNPCEAPHNENVLHANLTITEPMRGSVYLNNDAVFDSSVAQTYDLLIERTGKSQQDVLALGLNKLSNAQKLEEWLKTIQKKYGLVISDTLSFPEGMTLEIFTQLEMKGKDAKDFILNEFVYPKKTVPKITAEEWNNLKLVFEDATDISFEEFVKSVSPSIQATIDLNYFSIELDTSTFQAYHPFSARKKHKAMPCKILVKCKKLEINELTGSSAKIENIYHQQGLLTGTKVFLKIENLSYIDDENARISAFYSLRTDWFFDTDRKKRHNGNFMQPRNYFKDYPELADFSGVHSNKAKTWLPMAGLLVEGHVSSIYLNNTVVAGLMQLSNCIVERDSVIISAPEKRIAMSVNAFKESINALGFDETEVTFTTNPPVISFLRRVPKKAGTKNK